MLDIIIVFIFLVIFFTGVQVGASVGGIPTMVRWVADKLDSWLHRDKKKDDSH